MFSLTKYYFVIVPNYDNEHVFLKFCIFSICEYF